MPAKCVVLTPVKVNSVVLTPPSLVGGYWRLSWRSWQRAQLKGRLPRQDDTVSKTRRPQFKPHLVKMNLRHTKNSRNPFKYFNHWVIWNCSWQSAGLQALGDPHTNYTHVTARASRTVGCSYVARSFTKSGTCQTGNGTPRNSKEKCSKQSSAEGDSWMPTRNGAFHSDNTARKTHSSRLFLILQMACYRRRQFLSNHSVHRTKCTYRYTAPTSRLRSGTGYILQSLAITSMQLRFPTCL